MSKIYNINNHLMEYKSNFIDDIGALPIPAGIQIGSQIWATTNLNYDDGEGGITIKYNNISANGVDFGTQYYYTWDAAIRVANKIPGWHLPSLAEWNTLVAYVGGSSVAGTKLKSTSGWNNAGNGTDDYGFSALPVGYCIGSSVFYIGGESDFLTADEESSSNAYHYYLYTGTMAFSYKSSKTNRYSVRLVKD